MGENNTIQYILVLCLVFCCFGIVLYTNIKIFMFVYILRYISELIVWLIVWLIVLLIVWTYSLTCKRQYILELCLVFCCKRTYRYLNLVWPVKDKSDKKWEKTSDDRVGFSPLLGVLVITLLRNTCPYMPVHSFTLHFLTGFLADVMCN